MHVELDPRRHRGAFAVLRPLTGRDELALDPERPGAAEALLERLIAPVTGAAVVPGGLAALTITDRDRLLAAVFRDAFGDDVLGAATCSSCGLAFEFGFALRDLVAHQESDRAEGIQGPDTEGFYCTTDGVRFRLPTVGDLDSVRTLSCDQAVPALLARCAAPELDAERVQQAMERVAPVLDVDIAARCPHCGASQDVSFDLESYLVGALARERGFLTHEVHRLATAYGWGLADILDLAREDRRTLVRQVEAERTRRSAP